MGRPVASVIMIVRDDEAHVGGQLAALAAQETDVPWELVVVDDGSTDRTPDIIAAALPGFADARVVRRPAAHSVAGARNTGAAAARGEVLLFCDSDDRVAPGWIDAFVRAVAAPVPPGAERVDAASGCLDLEALNEPGIALVRPEVAGEGLPVFCGHPFAYGANCAWRAETFARLGGYRELFAGAAAEDVDLGLRAERAGMRIVPCPEAVLAYRFRSDPLAVARQYRNYERSLAAVWRDHFEPVPGRWWVHRTATRASWLVRHLPDTRADAAGRGRWWMRAGVLAGTVEGSARFGVRYGGAVPRPTPLDPPHPRRHRVDDRAVRHLRADAPDGPASVRDRAMLEVGRAQRLARTYRAGRRRSRPRDPLLVVCQPRTGSTLVFELLNQSPGFSIASEVLHRRIAIGPPPLPGRAVAALHLDLTLRARTGSVVGAKLHLEQLDHAGLTPSDLLDRYPGARILVLYRQSLLEQYVSMVAARQTGQWRLDAGTRPRPTTVRVDRDELAAFCDVQRTRYQRALDDPAVVAASTILRYEDLAADPVGELRRSLADLGLDLDPGVSTTLRRQSSGAVLDRIEEPAGLDPSDPLLQLDLGPRVVPAGGGYPR